MALVRMYFAVENIAMTTAHWDALKASLGSIVAQGSQANELLQTQDSLNGQVRILEALFESTDIDPNAFAQRLSTITGIGLNRITRTDSSMSYATGTTTFVALYSYSNAQRVRVRLFGGATPLPTYAQSWNEEQAYLVANADAWYDYSGGS